MISRILAKLFPPELGRVAAFQGCITLHLIEQGELAIVDPGPRESWAGNVKEWSGGRWTKILPTDKRALTHLLGRLKNGERKS